jgi:hypothetical protein
MPASKYINDTDRNLELNEINCILLRVTYVEGVQLGATWAKF